MSRVIEIKRTELITYGSELIEKIQAYLSCTSMLLDCGKAHTKRYIMSDKRLIYIHHTDKSIIVE